MLRAGLPDPPRGLIGPIQVRVPLDAASGCGPKWACTQATAQGWPLMLAKKTAFMASMSMSWPSYVPTSRRSSWTWASASQVPRWTQRPGRGWTSRDPRSSPVSCTSSGVSRRTVPVMVPARALGLDVFVHTGAGPGLAARSRPRGSRASRRRPDERPLQRQAGSSQLHQPACVAADLPIARATSAVERDAREAVDVEQ